eukprot:TRINITY_DN37684_c0_g1_i1.p1 TRINITY_DN37684_c0_g1~~TRINITY_DN37684_c0_g1_i1.p1  ORF type:complete len:344 (+),score=23.03 TRINITY_DN37684_c0_g1_i1:65-1096(+)
MRMLIPSVLKTWMRHRHLCVRLRSRYYSYSYACCHAGYDSSLYFSVVASIAASAIAFCQFDRQRQFMASAVPLSLRNTQTNCVACDEDYTSDASHAQEEEILNKVVAAFPDGAAAWLTGGDVKRMLVATEGDAPKAVAKLKEAAKWRMKTLNAWLAIEADNLRTAETRVVAIGHQMRPLVYSGCVNQRRGEEAGRILACVWDAALNEAGPMAQLDYVLDAHGYQPLLNLNVMPYLNLARSLDSYFAERFHQIVILDMPKVLVWLIQAILPLMPAKTRNKVLFVSRSNPDQMESLFRLCVDEEMKTMFEELLLINGRATSSVSREDTHRLTNCFLASQRSKAKS